MTSNDSNLFVKKMQTVYGLAYHASITRQNRTKHVARTHVFEMSLLVPKFGPYKEIKDYLESSIEVHLQVVEKQLPEECETVFKNISHDFANVCPCRADDT